MEKINKKATTFGNLLPMVITFIIVGLGIILGAYMTSQIKTSIASSASASETNETLTTVENATGEYVSQYTLPGFSMNTGPSCYNASNGAGIGSGNFTATAIGLIKDTSANCTGDPSGFCNYDWNCTYNYAYTIQDATYNASGKVEQGISTFANMMPIIAIALVFAIVISIIVGFLVIKGRR